MKKILSIRRQASPTDAPYWERYVYESAQEHDTVATVLRRIAADEIPGDRQDGKVRPLVWEHSCLQKKCGACAMVINGKPGLACDTWLGDLPGETVTIEPLRKFPIVEDLLVDRSAMPKRLTDMEVWLDGAASVSGEQDAFEASKCLQCGLCLEVCPNYAQEGEFAGMAGMAPIARLIAKLPVEQRAQIAQDYRAHVYEGCGKSLACRDICPAEIDMEHLLVKNNAAAVWGRWGGKRKSDSIPNEG